MQWTSQLPFIIGEAERDQWLRMNGALADVAMDLQMKIHSKLTYSNWQST